MPSESDKTAWPVSVEVEGKSYSGAFSVQGDVMTVIFRDICKTAKLRGYGIETLARVLLKEIVLQQRRSQKSE